MASEGRPVALVTGASRGIGRGVASELVEAGHRVYGTGRTVMEADLPGEILRVPCDHMDDAQVRETFGRIDREVGRLDLLVNSAWGGYERMVEDDTFTWSWPFWKQPVWRWDAMMGAGVRAAFVASQHAARLMVPAGRGLIVHLSHWAARKHIGNTLYGLAKAATDKMASDMGHELGDRDVTVVSLYPGLVRTEAVLASGAFDLENSESPRFIGRAILALAGDPDVGRWSGRTLVAAELARHYDFRDIDGSRPRPLTLDEA